MTLLGSETLRKIRAGELSLGFGVHHLRTAATPLIAKAAGYDWLFIDGEHGAFSSQEATQMCLAALSTGVAPIVRVLASEINEGARMLDNGALGIVVPHIDTLEQAKALVDMYRYPPLGHRSAGGPPSQFGFRAPAAKEALAALNQELLVIPMIETPLAVENADAIAAVEGIDVLLIGSNDLSTEMGYPGQVGHEKVHAAFATVAKACKRHNKVLGMGGVYDQETASAYIGMGASFVLAGSDHNFLMDAAGKRAAFLRGLKK